MSCLGRQDRPRGPGSAECRVAGSHPCKHDVFPDRMAMPSPTAGQTGKQAAGSHEAEGRENFCYETFSS